MSRTGRRRTAHSCAPRGWSIAHQKRSELRKKQACCAMCQPKLSSARSNRSGACHAHMTAPWTTVAVTGSVSRRHSDCSGDFQLPPSARRSGRGRPQARTAPAPDAASSKVATSMISSCSIMCMVKLRSPASCSGEVSGSARTVQPDRNSAGRTGVRRALRQPRPTDEVDQQRECERNGQQRIERPA